MTTQVIDKCVKLIIYSYNRKVLTCLKFVQMCDEDGHDSLEEVAAAMLNEEKVMKIEECDDNPDLLAMVPFVNPSCPLHQQSSHVGEAVTPLSEVPAPKVDKFFLYQIVTSKEKG